MCLRAGGMAEFHIRELLGSLDHIVLMTEAVGEDDVAAAVREVRSGLVAFLTFRNVGLQNVFHAQRFAGFFCSVDEVEVIGGVFIVQENESCLDGLEIRRDRHRVGPGFAVFGRGDGRLGRDFAILRNGGGRFGNRFRDLRRAGKQRQRHQCTQKNCQKLLHGFPPVLCFWIGYDKHVAVPYPLQCGWPYKFFGALNFIYILQNAMCNVKDFCSVFHEKTWIFSEKSKPVRFEAKRGFWGNQKGAQPFSPRACLSISSTTMS